MSIAIRQNILKMIVALTKTLFLGTQRVAIGLACIAAIGLGLYLAYLEKVSAASACFTAGIILFLLSNIELFESIKAPGIHATMRKIDDKIREVEELADKVAKTSTVTAEFCMEIMARIGRLSGPIPRTQALSLVTGMSDQLLELGVEKEKIDRLLEPWRNIVIFDLLQPARIQLEKTAQKIHYELDEVLRKVRQPINPEDPQYQQYLIQREGVNKVLAKVRRAMDEGQGLARIDATNRAFEELFNARGTEGIEDPDVITESLRHASYFASNHKFLDIDYWAAKDPTHITDFMNE